MNEVKASHQSVEMEVEASDQVNNSVSVQGWHRTGRLVDCVICGTMVTFNLSPEFENIPPSLFEGIIWRESGSKVFFVHGGNITERDDLPKCDMNWSTFGDKLVHINQLFNPTRVAWTKQGGYVMMTNTTIVSYDRFGTNLFTAIFADSPSTHQYGSGAVISISFDHDGDVFQVVRRNYAGIVFVETLSVNGDVLMNIRSTA